MATRRSRIQVKPNTGRVGGTGPAKPAPAKASPRKSSVSKPPNVEIALSGNSVNVTEKAPPPPPATEIVNSVTPSAAQSVICSPVRQEVPPVVSEKEVVNEKPVEDVETATENVSGAPTKDSEPAKPKRRPRVSKPPQPNIREASVRGAKRREPEPVAQVEDSVVQTERRSEPPVVIVEETSPAESPALPRPSGKAILEKRARKEHKELQARKRRQYRTGSKTNPPDRSSMTMLDLIYYNPPGNPMPEKTSKTTVVEEVTTTEAPHEEEEENAEEESVGPRVRVGPDGEITIDEESLVIRRGPTKDDGRAVVYETGTETHYGSFRKKTSGKRTWTTRETARFYRALSVCGTDFTLMSTFFPKRTRQDLKNKFKREERINRELVDKTINDPTQFDTVGLEDDEEEEELVDDPDDPRSLQNGHESHPPRKRRKGRQSKNADKPDESVIDVEMEVVEEDTAADNVVPLNEEERASTPPPVPQACATSLVGSSPPPLSQGQLVFYASHSQEQVVHVFVVSPQANVSASELVNRLNTPPLSQQKGTQQGTPLVGLASPSAQVSPNGAYANMPSHSMIHRTPGVSFLPKGITPLNTSPLQSRQQSRFECQKGITPVSETSMQPLSSQEVACGSTLQEKSPPLGVHSMHASDDNPVSSPEVTPEAVSACEVPRKEKMGPLLTPLKTGSVVAHASTSAEKSKDQRTVVSASEQSQNVPTPLREKSAQAATCENSPDVRLSEPLTTSLREEFAPVSAHEQLQKVAPLSTCPRENATSPSDIEATPAPLSPPVREECVPQSAGQVTALNSGPLSVQGPLPKETPEPLETPLNTNPSPDDRTLVKENTGANSAPLTMEARNVPQGVPKQTSAPLKLQGATMRRRRAVVCPKTTSEPRVRQKAGAT